MVKLIASLASGTLAAIGTSHYLTFNPHTSTIATVYHGYSISWVYVAFGCVFIGMFAMLGGKH